MDYIGIEIGRVWDNVDDDGWVMANDGSSQCKISTDWEEGGQEHLGQMGKALSRFPRKIPSQYSHEIRRKGDAPYLALRTRADNPRHILLEVTMRSTRTQKLLRPEAEYPRKVDIFAPTPSPTDLLKDEFDGECLVSFKVEPLAIHRLGELLLKFSERHRDTGLLKYRILRWSPNPDNDALIDFELPKLDEALTEWERLKREHPLQRETPRKEPSKPDNDASVEFEFPKQEHTEVEHLQMDPALKE